MGLEKSDIPKLACADYELPNNTKIRIISKGDCTVYFKKPSTLYVEGPFTANVNGKRITIAEHHPDLLFRISGASIDAMSNPCKRLATFNSD